MISSEPSPEKGAPARHHSVIVIGGGQAGLAISYCLKQRGIDHLVFEKHRIGHEWRERRWDSFCLVTPNWQCRLPGFPYDGPDPHGFMQKDEIVGYLEAYARSFDPPMLRRCGGHLPAARAPAAASTLGTSAGDHHADEVVIAIGGYHTPSIPRLAERLPESIVQLHSSAYRNAAALPDGDVLVVGTGQSGCQIAEDLHLAGRRVHLCVGSAPRTARRYRGKRRRRVARRHGLLPPGGRRASPARPRARQGQPLRDRPRRRPRHRPAPARPRRDAALRPPHRRRNGRLEFADDLKANLDQADAVAESIKTSIDKFITDRGIEAPTEPRYRPVWEPEGDTPSLDLASTPLAAVVWCDRLPHRLQLDRVADLRRTRLPDAPARRHAGRRPLFHWPPLAAHLGLRPLLRASPRTQPTWSSASNDASAARSCRRSRFSTSWRSAPDDSGGRGRGL